VRGEYAHPLYKFLSDKKLNGAIGASPRWNFQKYLLNASGEVVDFFYPFTKPNSSRIKKRINKLLITDKL
jgi:glutathione peroxidase